MRFESIYTHFAVHVTAEVAFLNDFVLLWLLAAGLRGLMAGGGGGRGGRGRSSVQCLGDRGHWL